MNIKAVFYKVNGPGRNWLDHKLIVSLKEEWLDKKSV